MSANVPVLYIDPVAGASGDMFLGALVDLGADFDALRAMLDTLNVPGFRLERAPAFRQTIGGTKVDVVVEDAPHPHRHVGDLLAIVDAAALPERVKQRSRAVLGRLARAEAAVHRMPVERVHLHEVGGLDALVDVVGTCAALEILAVDRIYSGPVSLGTGTIACAHGKMPSPAPGTLAILEGFPVRKTSINHEMTTPTGAAIIAALATGFVEPLVLVPRRVGYGAGASDPREFCNLLRIVLADVPRKLIPAHHHASEPGAHSHDHGHDHAHDHALPHTHPH
ncbi:MAG: LarC family nickel insertion protein [Candidatus Sumerlaeia bacterium]|nr:LarC family nickel insertion protein [Candidatus Sumerlaeia bacterium]